VFEGLYKFVWMLEMSWIHINWVTSLGQRIKTTCRVHIFPLPLFCFVFPWKLFKSQSWDLFGAHNKFLENPKKHVVAIVKYSLFKHEEILWQNKLTIVFFIFFAFQNCIFHCNNATHLRNTCQLWLFVSICSCHFLK
jgi:hypothetical protein